MNIVKKIILDGDIQRNPIDIYKLFSNEFYFGPYFGNNPDALFDFMTPIDSDDKPVVIYWYNSEVFKCHYPKEFEQLIFVFNKICDFENKDKEEFQFNIL